MKAILQATVLVFGILACTKQIQGPTPGTTANNSFFINENQIVQILSSNFRKN